MLRIKNKENIKNALSINQNKSKSIIQPKLLKKKTEKINISSNSFKEIKSEVNTPHSKINLSIKLNNNEETLTKDDLSQLDSNIANPPLDSFLSTKEDIHFDKNFFQNLVEKSKNFNLETQRRGRRRSRFPDPQWDCAELQISKIVRYLCEEEMSSSYQKYCKPVFEQINTLIESFLYHDNNLEICQNIHMCPVTIDIHHDHDSFIHGK